MSVSAAKRHLQSLRRNGPPGQPLLQWGFIVYRTAYGPASDQLWQSLLETIRSAVRTSVLSLAERPRRLQYDNTEVIPVEEAAACDELFSLFYLDVKENPQTLGGASIEAVRQIAKQAVAELPSVSRLEITDEPEVQDETSVDEAAMHQLEAYIHRSEVFLYIDDQVLQSAAHAPDPWVKVVEVDYEPTRHRGNARWGPQRYFGAMGASVSSLFTLWDDLGGRELSGLAPETKDGEMAILWDGAFGHETVEARVRIKSGVLDFEV